MPEQGTSSKQLSCGAAAAHLARRRPTKKKPLSAQISVLKNGPKTGLGLGLFLACCGQPAARYKLLCENRRWDRDASHRGPSARRGAEIEPAIAVAEHRPAHRLVLDWSSTPPDTARTSRSDQILDSSTPLLQRQNQSLLQWFRILDPHINWFSTGPRLRLVPRELAEVT